VLFGAEPARRDAGLAERAAGNLEEPVARPAMEVVVMILARLLVHGPERRMADAQESPFRDEEIEIAVDGHPVQRSDGATRKTEDLLHADRPVPQAENVTDRPALDGLPPRFHDPILPRAGH